MLNRYKIKHPLAVKDADVKLVSAKSQTAVDACQQLELRLLSAFPAVYPDPETFV